MEQELGRLRGEADVQKNLGITMVCDLQKPKNAGRSRAEKTKRIWGMISSRMEMQDILLSVRQRYALRDIGKPLVQRRVVGNYYEMWLFSEGLVNCEEGTREMREHGVLKPCYKACRMGQERGRINGQYERGNQLT